jgi:WD40 repeat protein
VRFSSISPDKRWVVTASHISVGNSKNARIWDADKGKFACELPIHHPTRSHFSPDSRWLVTCNATGNDLWKVNSWQHVRSFDRGAVAISPDNLCLAFGDSRGTIRLVEIESGREIARLTGPVRGHYAVACFSSDGTKLLAEGPDHTAIYVFDLRLIREQLAALRLDWDWPPFPRRRMPRSCRSR